MEEEILSGEMKEILNQIMIEINLVIISLILIISRKSPGRNNHNAPKLIEKYNNLARKPYLVEIKFCQKIIFNMRTISQEF